jgi:metal-responsive CopG/Arc/MetJ family transcriptional regulator
MDVRITDNALIFQAVIRKSVPTIPKNIYRFVDRICKKHGLSVRSVTGNFEVIRFELDQYISEEQAIDISNWIRQDKRNIE